MVPKLPHLKLPYMISFENFDCPCYYLLSRKTDVFVTWACPLQGSYNLGSYSFLQRSQRKQFATFFGKHPLHFDPTTNDS